MNEPARWVVLALAVVLAGAATRLRPSARATTLAAAIASAALSALYIPVYLRGGPRIIDATAYWLEARALAEGHLSFPIGDPESAIAGRFLVRDTLASNAGANVAVLFPPGYPAVLAIGFLLRVPLAVGPVIAALLTLATARLARALGEALALDDARRDGVQSATAILCAASGTLRYHTADTMSHGLAALCFTAAVLGALRVVASDGPRRAATGALLLGASLGLLVATRPVSGIACASTIIAIVAGAMTRRRVDARRIAIAACVAVLAALPFVALLLFHQHAATGAWLRSAQSLYYTNNDGPPGCFRYGFGEGIGCLLEHGPYVERNLPRGYGLLPALHTTGVRLWIHAGDTLNLFALGPLTIACLVFAMKTRGLRVLALGPLLLVALYAPFYFDGSYPGGGGRFYVDALPLELLAIAFATDALVARLARACTAERRARWIARAPLLLGASSLLGFAFRGAAEHELLRDRDRGPMWDATFVEQEVRARGPEAPRAVVFVRTDHGFGLAFDPDRALDYDVARVRGPALDRLAMDALGAREAFLYEDPTEGAPSPRLVPYDPDRGRPIEVEALYPPVEQRRGWAFTREAEGASDGRELGVALDADGRAMIVLALPQALRGRSIALDARGAGRVVARGADASAVTTWDIGGCDEAEKPLEMKRTDAKLLPGGSGPLRLEIETTCPVFSLDTISLL